MVIFGTMILQHLCPDIHVHRQTPCVVSGVGESRQGDSPRYDQIVVGSQLFLRKARFLKRISKLGDSAAFLCVESSD